MVEATGFNAALGVCWALVMVLVIGQLTATRRSVFGPVVLGGLVVLQFYYIYRAAQKELRSQRAKAH